MKISIYIEDATPDELRQVVGVYQSDAPKNKPPALKGAKTNFFAGPWSDAERDAVLSVGEGEAWKNYQKLFPTSKRTRNGVCRMREDLVKKGIKPINQSIEVKQSVKAIALSNNVKVVPPEQIVESRAYHGSGNKYDIPPTLLKTDKNLYQRLWFRCKNKGIKYEQALALEKPHRSTSVIESNIITKENTTTPPITEIKLDTRVKQIGGSKIMSGIGRVIKIRGDNLLVRFDNGMDWMPRKHIAVVTKPGA